MTRLDLGTYFMQVAEATARRSTCVDKQVGAIIIDETLHIISTGYNGNPKGFEDCCDMEKCNKDCGDGTCYAVHAEANALLQAGKSAKHGQMFVTLEPCIECAKLAINAGIRRITFLNKNTKSREYHLKVKGLLNFCGVQIFQFDGGLMKEVTD